MIQATSTRTFTVKRKKTSRKSKPLTKRQQQIFIFVREKILMRGYGPTFREIADHFGMKSTNGVMCHLNAIEKKGLITRECKKSRGIQLTGKRPLLIKYGGEIS